MSSKTDKPLTTENAFIEMVANWKKQLDIVLYNIKQAQQIADYQAYLDCAEAALISLRGRMLKVINPDRGRQGVKGGTE